MQHRKPAGGLRARWHGWTLRRRLMVVASVAGLLAVAGVAFALLLFRAGITGSVTVGEAPAIEWSTVTFANPSDDGATCAATINGGVLNVTIDNAFAGNSYCRVSAKLINTATTSDAPVVQDLVFNNSIASGFEVGCGVPIQTLANGATAVVLRFVVPSGAAAGVYNAAADAGVVAVPAADYVSADCPPAPPLPTP